MLLTKEQQDDVDKALEQTYKEARDRYDAGQLYDGLALSRYSFCDLAWIPTNGENFEFLKERYPEFLRIAKRVAKRHGMKIVRTKRGTQKVDRLMVVEL